MGPETLKLERVRRELAEARRRSLGLERRVDELIVERSAFLDKLRLESLRADLAEMKLLFYQNGVLEDKDL